MIRIRSIYFLLFLGLSACVALGADSPAPQRAPVATGAKAGKHLFILSGQSNMRQPLIGTFADTVKKIFGEDKVIVASLARTGQPS